jgi:hypothetical protein
MKNSGIEQMNILTTSLKTKELSCLPMATIVRSIKT